MEKSRLIRKYEPVDDRLDEAHDEAIRKLWSFGWDTGRIADHLECLRPVRKAGRFRPRTIREADVYNVLDRALRRRESDIVKAS